MESCSVRSSAICFCSSSRSSFFWPLPLPFPTPCWAPFNSPFSFSTVPRNPLPPQAPPFTLALVSDPALLETSPVAVIAVPLFTNARLPTSSARSAIPLSSSTAFTFSGFGGLEGGGFRMGWAKCFVFLVEWLQARAWRGALASLVWERVFLGE